MFVLATHLTRYNYYLGPLYLRVSVDALEPHVLNTLTGLYTVAVPELRNSFPECVYQSRATDLTCYGSGCVPIPVLVAGWVAKYKQ